MSWIKSFWLFCCIFLLWPKGINQTVWNLLPEGKGVFSLFDVLWPHILKMPSRKIFRVGGTFLLYTTICRHIMVLEILLYKVKIITGWNIIIIINGLILPLYLSEILFETTLISMINLPGCIVLPQGVAKIFQIWKIQRFDKSDRKRYFRFDHREFLSE